MISRTISSVSTLFTVILATTAAFGAADGVLRGKFSYDGIATCEKPAVKDFPIHAEGTASMSTNRAVRLDMSSNTGGRTSVNAKLGEKTEIAGGSATVNVLGRHTLRAVRDFPNNIAIVTMTVVGNSCRMTLVNKLKPGKQVYTFVSGSSVSYCSRMRITHTECAAY
jgi:hypothetical protein